MGEEKDNRGYNKPLVAILAGSVIMATVGYLRYIKPMARHNYLRLLAVQDSDLPSEEVDEYLRRGVFWTWINELATKEINVSKLDVLMNDPEIIKKANESRWDSPIKVIVRMVREDDDFIWDDYCKWRVNGGGVCSLQAARRHGLGLEELLAMPFKPTENDFKYLDIREVPVRYSKPLLLQGRRPEDIFKLYSRDIPIEYTLPLEKEEISHIANKYSIERTGASDNVREKYRSTYKIPPEYKTDDKIRVWEGNGMTFYNLVEIAVERAEYVRDAFTLVEQDKLNGDIYNDWRPEIGIADTLFGLAKGYSKEQALRASLLGRSLRELDQDVLYHPLVDEVRRDRELKLEPMLNHVPK